MIEIIERLDTDIYVISNGGVVAIASPDASWDEEAQQPVDIVGWVLLDEKNYEEIGYVKA